MLIFIDTEFTDFIDTELISIGLVSQDDRKFYAELPVNRNACIDFVREVVLPQMGKIDGAKCNREELDGRLRAWLDQYKTDNDFTLICYDYTGDWILFCNALFDEIPSWIRGVNVNKYIDSFRDEIFWTESNLTRHHALHDAMALKASFVLGRAEREQCSLNCENARTLDQ